MGDDPRVIVDARAAGRPARRFAWAWVPAALLVGAILLTLRGDPSPPVDTVVDPGPAETTTTTTTVPFEGDLTRGWTAIDLPGDGELTDVVETSGGLLAFGIEPGGAFVWRSSDGWEWEPVPDPGAVFAGGTITGSLVTADAIVAFGAVEAPPGSSLAGSVPAAWTSRDGKAWQRATFPGGSGANETAPAAGMVLDGIEWAGRAIAVGSMGLRGAVWLSEDGGRTWRTAAGLADMAGRGSVVNAVLATEEELVAIGRNAARPAVWVSSGGDDWRRLGAESGWSSYSDLYPDTGLPGGPGYVAAGARVVDPMISYPVTWLSRDGEEWLEVPHQGLAGVEFSDLAAAGPGLVATGSRNDELETSPGIWWSATGTDWEGTLLEGSRIGMEEVRVNALTQGGPGLVAAGGLDGGPEVWVWDPSGTAQPAAWKRPRRAHWEELATLPTPGLAWTTARIGDRLVGFTDTHLWWSLDGRNWESVVLSDVGLGGVRPSSQPAVVGNRLYVLGGSGAGPSLWRSEDEGRSFSSVPLSLEGWAYFPNPSIPDDLVIAEGYGNGLARLRRSANGSTWTELPLPGASWLTSIEPLAGGYVMTGWFQGFGAALWAAGDGRGWESVEMPADGFGNVQVVSVGGTLLALSTADAAAGPVTEVWVQTDPGAWESTPVRWEGWAEAEAAGPGVVVTVYPPGEALEVWASSDGSAWTELEPVRAIRENGIVVLRDGPLIRVAAIRGDGSATLLEWVPPED